MIKEYLTIQNLQLKKKLLQHECGVYFSFDVNPKCSDIMDLCGFENLRIIHFNSGKICS